MLMALFTFSAEHSMIVQTVFWVWPGRGNEWSQQGIGTAFNVCVRQMFSKIHQGFGIRLLYFFTVRVVSLLQFHKTGFLMGRLVQPDSGGFALYFHR